MNLLITSTRKAITCTDIQSNTMLWIQDNTWKRIPWLLRSQNYRAVPNPMWDWSRLCFRDSKNEDAKAFDGWSAE